MQLIVEADNSNINIKEKMTTLEDSIDILMNGVAEIERTPEKEKGSNTDKENILNGDSVIESKTNIDNGDKALLEAVPAPPCNDISEKNTPEDSLLNSDKQNCFNKDDVIESKKNVEAEDKTVLAEVSAQTCEESSENKTLEEGTVTKLDKENSFNGHKVTEILNNSGSGEKSIVKEVPSPLCEDVPKSKNLETEKLSNPDIINNLNVDVTKSKKNVGTENQGYLERGVPASPCDVVSKHEILEKQQLSKKADCLNGDIIEIYKDDENADKTVIKEIPTPPCEDVSENNSTKSIDESHVLLETCKITTKVNNNAEFRIKISDKTDSSLDKQVDQKPEECYKEGYNNIKNITEKHSEKLVEHSTNEKKLETEDPEVISEHKCKDTVKNYEVNEHLHSDAELCKSIEDETDLKQLKNNPLNNQDVDMSDGVHTGNKVDNSDTVKIQYQEDSNNVNECNFEKQNTEKVGDLITKSENFTKNTAYYTDTISSPAVDNTEISTINKNTDMECDETVPIVTELNESTLTSMDCGKNDHSDFTEKDLLDHVTSSQIVIKEDTQVVKTDSHIKEATTEESNQVENAKNKPKEIQEENTSTTTESIIVEKMDLSEETETIKIIKENETPKTPDKTVEVEKILSGFNDTEESMEKQKSDLVSLKTTDSPCKDVSSDIEEVKVIDIQQEAKSTETTVTSKVAEKPTPVVCKLSNTLNILSDDEDEPPKTREIQAFSTKPNYKQCINIEDDDDVMVIEETMRQDKPESVSADGIVDNKDVKPASDSVDEKISEVIKENISEENDVKESAEPEIKLDDLSKSQTLEKIAQEPTEKIMKEQPLLPKDLFKSYKKNLSEMTRDDLEDFVILKIVESIIDRSSLNEIKTKLKTMTQTIEEYKKKSTLLTKQNRDLQVVLKSIQEEQKKGGDAPIVPLKITRSVGMQVLMTDKNTRRKVIPTPSPGPSPNVNNRPVRNVNQGPRHQAPVNETNQQIPVPRLVPASNNAAANKTTLPVISNRITAKPNQLSMPSNVRSSPPAPKVAEKRGRTQSSQSITVDLTDDEPPPKIQATKTSPAPPVRLVPSQNLLGARAQTTSNTLANPRKVYIPIGSNQNQNVRPGQTIMLKNVPPSTSSGPRPRGAPPMGARGPTPNQIRMGRVIGRHPAPLPDAIKQYQPPNWKALPPAPDLKLSKVENGIVISWKIDGYQEDSYEEIASYQLYAYQETSSPPNTTLWKKIGDVKALPLPMACTLTQFMAGYKYYFAVRAVDIKSRLGPFSLPGSILLLNKM